MADYEQTHLGILDKTQIAPCDVSYLYSLLLLHENFIKKKELLLWSVANPFPVFPEKCILLKPIEKTITTTIKTN